MFRFTLREMAHLLMSLVGAALLAIALASLDLTSAAHASFGFFASFAHRVSEIMRFDFGLSALSGRADGTELVQRMPATLILLAFGGGVALIVGMPLGLLLGAGPLRRAAAPLIQLVAATPVFCVAMALGFVAVRFLHWPVHSTASATLADHVLHIDPAQPVAVLKSLLLPALTVGAAGTAIVQMALRRGAATVALEPYRMGLRRLGLSVLEIDRAYVALQVLAVLVSRSGEFVLALISAAAVAEWVFDIPGTAVLFVKSVALADWAMAGLVLFVFSAFVLVADFAGRLCARAISDSGSVS